MTETCSTCLHKGETGSRCYDCKLGRGNTDAILWIGKLTCPLPRIGSKEWGWKWDARQQMYTSPKTSIGIQSPFGSTSIFCFYDVISGLDGVPLAIGRSLSLRDAKTLAEARARRDWRKEQGKR